MEFLQGQTIQDCAYDEALQKEWIQHKLWQRNRNVGVFCVEFFLAVAHNWFFTSL
jgi:hypothetical protein